MVAAIVNTDCHELPYHLGLFVLCCHDIHLSAYLVDGCVVRFIKLTEAVAVSCDRNVAAPRTAAAN